MKKLHIICRREGIGFKGVTRETDDRTIYSSGHWDIPFEEAKLLIGGMIYLHPSKTEVSHFGGLVIDVRSVIREECKRENRVVFVFRPLLEAKNVKWSGADHSMAWSSGIHE